MVEAISKKRRSNHVRERLDIPEPSAAEKSKWAHIARLCWERVVTNPSSTVTGNKNMVVIAWPSRKDIPVGFPPGKNVENKIDSKVLKKYNAEGVLMWLYERKLCDKSVSDIYRLRNTVALEMDGVFTGLLLEHNANNILSEFSID